MKKGIIYVRVSSDRQVKEGHGLESQEKSCKIWAQKNNVYIINIFKDEGISGANYNRPGFKKMIEFISKHKVDYIICDDIDRISRDVLIWQKFYNLCISKGTIIKSLKQDINDTPEGELLTQISMATKEYERKNNSRRVKDRMKARLLEGYWPFPVLDGYKIDRNNKTIVFNSNSNLIKEGLIKFANGEISNKNKLLKFYIKRGIRTKKGNIPGISYVQRILSKKSLYFFAGYIIYEKWGINNPIKGKHSALIEESLMYKLFDRLNITKNTGRKVNSNILKKLWLRGIIKETTTGKIFTGGPSKGKKGNIYYYYNIRVIDRKTRKSKTINILSQKIDKDFNNFIRQFKLKNELIPIINDIIDNCLKDKKKNIQYEKKILSEEYNNISNKIDLIRNKILDYELNGKYELVQTYEENLSNLLERKKELEFKINNSDINEIEKVHSNTLNIFIDLSNILKIKDLSVRRDFINTLFGGDLYYNKNGGFQTPSIPFILHIFKTLNNQNNSMVDLTGIEPVYRSKAI